MANDRSQGNDRDREQQGQQGQQPQKPQKPQKPQHDAQKRDRTFGAGMDSPDSTEAVLDASTGLPDPRARGQRASQQQADGSDVDEEA